MRRRARGRAPRRGALPVALCCALAGCAAASDPGNPFQLRPESPARKAMQTRIFETPSETELLSASAAVLQDLGFQVSESERGLGFLGATKERSAREYGQEIGRDLVFLLSVAASLLGQNVITRIPVDLHQQINASLVTRPTSAEGTRHELRVLFYRVVWKGDGQSGNQVTPPGKQRMEMIRDPAIYQQFFARLSKAVFLEAHKI